MAKPKIATAWLAGCAGCHMSFLDIDAAIVGLADQVEFTRSPITDIKDFSPVDVGIVEGAINTTYDEEVARELRANCKIFMAWGDCACFGGICTLRNFIKTEDVLSRSYVQAESNKDGKIPVSEDIPRLLDKVLPVNHVVKVDCYVPGCPPSSKAILYAVAELLKGRIPVLPSEIMRFD